MTAYTNIDKPTGTPYTNLNPQGLEQYDQPDIAYDSSTTYYDGTDTSAYTNLPKPTGTAYTSVAKPTT